jgi:hypothetical protein
MKTAENTPLSINVKKSVETLIKQFDGHTLTLDVLANNLQRNDLIQPAMHMGVAEMTLAETLSKDVNQQNNLINEASFQALVTDSRKQLSALYDNRKRRENRIFQLCLLTAGVALTCLLGGTIYFFMYPDDKRVSLFTSLSSLFPTFISGTAFFIYQKENEKVKSIEDDIRQLLKIEAMLGIIASIPDGAIRQISYPKLFEQIKI